MMCSSNNVRLAQLDRAFGYGPKGRGFESSNARYCVRLCTLVIGKRESFKRGHSRYFFAVFLILGYLSCKQSGLVLEYVKSKEKIL